MSLLDTPLLERLTRYLDVNAFRQTLIASNLANLDTPGYRTRDVNFQAEMARALEPEDAGGGVSGTLLSATPVAHTVRSLLLRPDGNNVSLDREGLLLAETQLRYRLGTELVRAEFRRLAAAIRGGSAA
jgi:flagellar basal-body rod protein FlgB